MIAKSIRNCDGIRRRADCPESNLEQAREAALIERIRLKRPPVCLGWDRVELCNVTGCTRAQLEKLVRKLSDEGRLIIYTTTIGVCLRLPEVRQVMAADAGRSCDHARQRDPTAEEAEQIRWCVDLLAWAEQNGCQPAAEAYRERVLKWKHERKLGRSAL
jgi:hypothetical protein